MGTCNGLKIMFFYSAQVDVSKGLIKLGCIVFIEHSLKILNPYLLAQHLYIPSPFAAVDDGSIIIVV